MPSIYIIVLSFPLKVNKYRQECCSDDKKKNNISSILSHPLYTLPIQFKYTQGKVQFHSVCQRDGLSRKVFMKDLMRSVFYSLKMTSGGYE